MKKKEDKNGDSCCCSFLQEYEHYPSMTSERSCGRDDSSSHSGGKQPREYTESRIFYREYFSRTREVSDATGKVYVGLLSVS